MEDGMHYICISMRVGQPLLLVSPSLGKTHSLSPTEQQGSPLPLTVKTHINLRTACTNYVCSLFDTTKVWIHTAHTQYLNIGAICRWYVHVMLLLQHLKLKPQVVNGNGVLSSKVLGNAYKGEGKAVRQWEVELCTMQVRTMHSLLDSSTHAHAHTHTHCLSTQCLKSQNLNSC